ncbi:MAG: hypothetical protein VXY34_05305 [Bdellovibrionota bacterium]|nr:hypothetical protein [Bdellovibrionota bacterium]
MYNFIANLNSLKVFVISTFCFFSFLSLFFQNDAKAMTIPFPVTIKCQEGETVIYVPLVKGGAPLVPQCVANI